MSSQEAIWRTWEVSPLWQGLCSGKGRRQTIPGRTCAQARPSKKAPRLTRCQKRRAQAVTYYTSAAVRFARLNALHSLLTRGGRARVGGHAEERVGRSQAHHHVASPAHGIASGGCGSPDAAAGGHHAHPREGVAVVAAARHHRAISGEAEPELSRGWGAGVARGVGRVAFERTRGRPA